MFTRINYNPLAIPAVIRSESQVAKGSSNPLMAGTEHTVPIWSRFPSQKKAIWGHTPLTLIIPISILNWLYQSLCLIMFDSWIHMFVGPVNKIPITWLLKPPFLRAKPPFADNTNSSSFFNRSTCILWKSDVVGWKIPCTWWFIGTLW